MNDDQIFTFVVFTIGVAVKKVSLVLCTLGPRKSELNLLFSSLSRQSFNLNDIELIIVDQNPHDENLDVLNQFPELGNITRYFKSKKGLSLSRNVGISHASGEIICFPDDDCIYESDIINRVYEYFKLNKSVSFISTNSKDPEDFSKSLVNFPRFDSGINTRHLIGCSFTLFFRYEFIINVQSFDEKMGVGTHTIFGAGEEHDFMLRGMALGHVGVYIHDLVVYHPAKGENFEINSFKRRLSYSAGLAYFLIKNRKFLERKIFYSYIINQFLMIFSSVRPSRVLLNLVSLYGFLRGIIYVYLRKE